MRTSLVRLAPVLLSSVVVALCAACAGPDVATSEPAPAEPVEALSRDIPVDPSARIDGDIGAVRGIDGAASYITERWDHGGRVYDYAQLDTFTKDGSWAMLGATFLGGVDHPDLDSGETLRFEHIDWVPDQDVQPEGFQVALVGCSDPDVGDDASMYDEDALYLDVVGVDNAEGERFVEVTAHFADGQVAIGLYPVR